MEKMECVTSSSNQSHERATKIMAISSQTKRPEIELCLTLFYSYTSTVLSIHYDVYLYCEEVIVSINGDTRSFHTSTFWGERENNQNEIKFCEP